MDVEFADPELERLYTDVAYTGRYAAAVVTAYRKRIQLIRNAPDERDFYALRSLHFEKLRGDRQGQHSMRLNDQWRLVLRLAANADGKTVVIIEIVDYH